VPEQVVFYPERRPGLIFYAVVILVFVLAGVIGLWQAAHASIGPLFLLYLLPTLVAIAVIPWFSYHAYALQNASYTLERDGIRLRWGLRLEDIPIDNVLWVHPASELDAPLLLPRLHWPGAVVGQRSPTGRGEVEFLASRTNGLILIATPEQSFAISPGDPNAFLRAFQRCTEMGSLTTLAARSIYPSSLLKRVWVTVPARTLLLVGLGLSTILLVWVNLLIPSHSQFHLGFLTDGSPGYTVPAVRLMLLPVINTFFYLADLLLGLFFFRREDSQPFSFLLWICGVLTPLLFLLAVFFILEAG